MSRNELRHFEHGHFLLAAKDSQELLIREDVALVLRVLEVVLLDVDPDLLNDFRAGHRTLSDNCFQFRRKVHWLCKGRIECSRHTDELN